MTGRARTGDFTVAKFLGIVLGLITLLILFFIIRHAAKNASTLFYCEGECLNVCPTTYAHSLKGDAYCRDHFEGTKAGGVRCCVPPQNGASTVVRPGEVRIIYKTQKKTLHDKELVTLVPEVKEKNVGFEGRFSFVVSGKAKGQKCFWRVGTSQWQEDVVVRDRKNLFQQLFKKYLDVAKNPKSGQITSVPCDQLKGTSTLEVPIIIKNGGVQRENLKLLGKELWFTLVVVDKGCKENDPNLCDTYEQTVRVKIPEWHPSVALSVDGAPVTHLVALEPGNHDFELLVKDPYPTCHLSYTTFLDGAEPFHLNFQSPFKNGGEDGTILQESACAGSDKRFQFTLDLPSDTPRAIPFTLNFTTSLTDDKAWRLHKEYSFVIAPEHRLVVHGPDPGYTKEKNIDISCTDVVCTSFQGVFLTNPLLCAPQKATQPSTTTPSGSGGRWINLDVEKKGDNMWRYVMKTEDQNGKYFCVKAKTTQGELYSLGLSQGVPSKVAIDATPPGLALSFDPLHGKLTMLCEDGGKYPTGCPEHPFSYAFVTDPLLFVGSVLTGGKLAADWRGCPDLETGYWIRWSGSGNPAVMPYLAKDVRVICVRAEDNAGNYVVKSTLLYDSAQALGLFLRTMAKKMG